MITTNPNTWYRTSCIWWCLWFQRNIVWESLITLTALYYITSYGSYIGEQLINNEIQ